MARYGIHPSVGLTQVRRKERADAHPERSITSMYLEAAERFNGFGRDESSQIRPPPAGNAMAMSVGIEADARQAAADKRAEEHSLVRKAQAGNRLAFEELVRRYDREVLRL